MFNWPIVNRNVVSCLFNLHTTDLILRIPTVIEAAEAYKRVKGLKIEVWNVDFYRVWVI